MSTACFELGREIPMRLVELKTLTDHARKAQEKDTDLYNVLCRSCCVLLASHLEGFVKDLTSSITADLNFYLNKFNDLPEALQTTFCQKIVQFDGATPNEMATRVKQLKSFFSTNPVKVDLKAFPYKENLNKNPSGNYIEGALDKIGIPSVLQIIATDYFQVVFDGSERSNYRLYRDMRRHVSVLHTFPFRGLPPSCLALRRIKGKPETFWHTFLEDVMIRRHNIVHGDIKSNEASWDDLAQDTAKLGILMYGLLFSSTYYICRPLT